MSSVSDYEYRGHYSDRQVVRLPRDVIRAPTPPPVIQRVVERAPTPEPDILERVIVRPQPQQLIERIIERPSTPPPKIIDKEITEPAPPPIVRTRVVKVDSRSYARNQATYASYTQPQILQRPINYNTQTYSRPTQALSNYGYVDAPQQQQQQYVDYFNYAPERSYSTTFSTNELVPHQSSYIPQQQSTYIPQQQQQQQQVQQFQPLQTFSYNPQAQAASSAYPSYGYPTYGYSYGYRPVYNNMLPQQQQQQQQTNTYQQRGAPNVAPGY